MKGKGVRYGEEGCPVGRGVLPMQQGVWRYLGSVDVDFYCAGMGERNPTQSYNPHETT